VSSVGPFLQHLQPLCQVRIAIRARTQNDSFSDRNGLHQKMSFEEEMKSIAQIVSCKCKMLNAETQNNNMTEHAGRLTQSV
jgi:Holliday junction resolvasome RuvABC ATP-dependent DNA helicase subunit